MGVNYLQQNNLTPLDLKPSNVFLVDVGEEKICKVGDYHILKNVERQENQIVGSACYLPPEVFTGDSQPGKASHDSWAAGCILYELCSRKRAFEARSIGALAMKVVDGAPDMSIIE